MRYRPEMEGLRAGAGLAIRSEPAVRFRYGGRYDKVRAAGHPRPVCQALCSEQHGRCINADPTQGYYKDDNHVGTAGAELVAPNVAQAVIGASAGQVDELTAVSLR